jgi:flagellar protein FliO/FliZ
MLSWRWIFPLCWLWLADAAALVPDTAATKPAARSLSAADMAGWGFSLIVVLGVFFLCVWGIRKFGGLSVNNKGERMRLLGGLTLGMREKVMLLQVGNKQLVLGVTPGRIETLLVLEGDDCLHNDAPSAETAELTFAQKLAQALKANPNV